MRQAVRIYKYSLTPLKNQHKFCLVLRNLEQWNLREMDLNSHLNIFDQKYRKRP